MEDDVLIDNMLGTSGRLRDVVFNAVEYLNNTEHNGTLDLLRSNMCTLIQETVLEALDIMVRTVDIHCSSNHQLVPLHIQTLLSRMFLCREPRDQIKCEVCAIGSSGSGGGTRVMPLPGCWMRYCIASRRRNQNEF